MILSSFSTSYSENTWDEHWCFTPKGSIIPFNQDVTTISSKIEGFTPLDSLKTNGTRHPTKRMARAGRKNKSSAARVTGPVLQESLTTTHGQLTAGCVVGQSQSTPPSRHIKLTNQQLLQMSYIFKQNQLSWAIKQFSSGRIHC